MVMKIQLSHDYNDIISIENLLGAWKEFIKGKRNRKDVQEFQYHLLDNLISLHNDLKYKDYIHGDYKAFNISDPKLRNVHKAIVRDRILHRAIYRIIYQFFDRKFISDSFSCRNFKGLHKAMNRFRNFSLKVSKNNTKTCWVLKCDIRKFFASINQEIMIEILEKHIPDKDIIQLLSKIVHSFYSTEIGKGLPLGNLTSQLLVNIYMNEFDQWIKHRIKAKYYIRYADDFVILSEGKDYLMELIPKIADFLDEYLKLSLHQDKVFVKTLASGIDFLGWVHFSNHRVLRTTTKRKMFRKIIERESKLETVQSYLGLLKHGNARLLEKKIVGIT